MPKLRTNMVDISEKPDVLRTCVAEGKLLLKKDTLDRIKGGKIEKGDCFSIAQSAALLALKKTPIVIPHCHPIPLAKAGVEFSYLPNGVKVSVLVQNIAKTGVEIEALHGVMIALLTVWDIVKKYEKNPDGQYPTTRITDVQVVEKEKKVI